MKHPVSHKRKTLALNTVPSSYFFRLPPSFIVPLLSGEREKKRRRKERKEKEVVEEEEEEEEVEEEEEEDEERTVIKVQLKPYRNTVRALTIHTLARYNGGIIIF